MSSLFLLLLPVSGSQSRGVLRIIRVLLFVPCLLELLTVIIVAAAAAADASYYYYSTNHVVLDGSDRTIVTNQAMGARCAVAADFDGDGRMDIVSASSTDNSVSWFRNEGPSSNDEDDDDNNNTKPIISFSIKKQITWSSLGSRIVTVADVDGDGDMDVLGASYYDSSLRWFENIDGLGTFEEHLISSAVNEGQGVTVADLDNDGDYDIATASSGDHTIAVFMHLDGKGTFCDVKQVVDDHAMGARTVIAADLNNDGWMDLASASKDDDTIAWYPNDGTGQFPTKHIISRGDESRGAYSLVAADIDDDGDVDLIVASNGNDHVSLWRNDGNGIGFTKTLIYDQADFVLSVTAVDFDHDGDIDVASASFFDGHVNWYENIDGLGYEWKNHTIYVGIQGHYVSHADIDGDGDDDLIAVTHAENTVAVYYAHTECDPHGNGTTTTTAAAAACCHSGTEWNGTTCVTCPTRTFGTGHGVNAKCHTCPTDCHPNKTQRSFIPPPCWGISVCSDNVKESIATCSCPTDTVRDPATDSCTACPTGQIRPALVMERGLDTLGNYSSWEVQQGICVPQQQQVNDGPPLQIVVPIVVVVILLVGLLILLILKQRDVIRYHTRDVQNAPKDGVVAIVFTDIEGSTALWDQSKSVMSTAIEIHHNIVRAVIQRHGAYEVKTIGDSFMIALASADAAVQLANDIQSDLVLCQEWPAALAAMPSACVEFATIPQPRHRRGREALEEQHRPSQPPIPIFRGLRVRIGVHIGQHSHDGIAPEDACENEDIDEEQARTRSSISDGEKGLAGGVLGQVQIRYDEVAKGYDYYGPAINAAARIESVGFGGQTLISSEVYARLSDTVKNNSVLKVLGGVDFKGVSKEIFLYQCLPISLKRRKFAGIIRRRDSMDITIIPDDESATVLLMGSAHDEDITSDIGSKTPLQLQTMLLRLRRKYVSLERTLDEDRRRRRRRDSNTSSDALSIPSEVLGKFLEQGQSGDESVGGTTMTANYRQQQHHHHQKNHRSTEVVRFEDEIIIGKPQQEA